MTRSSARGGTSTAAGSAARNACCKPASSTGIPPQPCCLAPLAPVCGGEGAPTQMIPIIPPGGPVKNRVKNCDKNPEKNSVKNPVKNGDSGGDTPLTSYLSPLQTGARGEEMLTASPIAPLPRPPRARA